MAYSLTDERYRIAARERRNLERLGMNRGSWRDKVQKEIARLCQASWHEANHDKRGKRYKKHRPYSIPFKAEALVEALGNDDEEKCKAIMFWPDNMGE